MKDPYEILGVPRSASIGQVKAAYRALAKKYHPDNYSDSDLAEMASRKMAEINSAYDEIMSHGQDDYYTQSDSQGYSGYGTQGTQSGYSGYGTQNDYSGFGTQNGYTDYSDGLNDYSAVNRLITEGRYDEAEQLLEGMNQQSRDAQWYFLKGEINYSRGWLDQAYTYYSAAYRMNPSNPMYRRAYESMQNSRTGGFRTTERTSRDDLCSLCVGLKLADCCCECTGHDLIPCC